MSDYLSKYSYGKLKCKALAMDDTVGILHDPWSVAKMYGVKMSNWLDGNPIIGREAVILSAIVLICKLHSIDIPSTKRDLPFGGKGGNREDFGKRDPLSNDDIHTRVFTSFANMKLNAATHDGVGLHDLFTYALLHMDQMYADGVSDIYNRMIHVAIGELPATSVIPGGVTGDSYRSYLLITSAIWRQYIWSTHPKAYRARTAELFGAKPYKIGSYWQYVSSDQLENIVNTTIIRDYYYGNECNNLWYPQFAMKALDMEVRSAIEEGYVNDKMAACCLDWLSSTDNLLTRGNDGNDDSITCSMHTLNDYVREIYDDEPLASVTRRTMQGFLADQSMWHGYNESMLDGYQVGIVASECTHTNALLPISCILAIIEMNYSNTWVNIYGPTSESDAGSDYQDSDRGQDDYQDSTLNDGEEDVPDDYLAHYNDN